MLQSFYKYLVDELLVGYFTHHPIEKGSKYYLVLEDEKNFDGVVEALRYSPFSHDITIKTDSVESLNVEKDSYHTMYLKPVERFPGLVIGNNKTAEEAFLVNMRNCIGNSGEQLEDYGILYLLKSDRIESITTTAIDLTVDAYPFNSNEIKRNIQSHIESVIKNANERIYLNRYLDRLSTYVEEGSSNLFDFEDILDVLQGKTLKGKFNQLEYFNDDDIFAPSFKKSDKEVEARADKNAEIYAKIKDIFATFDDKEERIEKICAIVDKKTAKKIVDANNVDDISFSLVEEGVENKKTNKIELISLNLIGQGAFLDMVKHTKGNRYKSRNYIVICDETKQPASLKATFNQSIKDFIEGGENCNVYLETFTKTVVEGRAYVAVNDKNSNHEFFIVKLPVNSAFFNNVRALFSISKNGNIIIDAPEDEDEVVLGNGDEDITLDSVSNTIVWKDTYKLHIPCDIDGGVDKKTFSITFDGVSANFVVKIDTNKMVPLSPIKIFEKIWTGQKSFKSVARSGLDAASFAKIGRDDEEYAVFESFRWFLETEKQMIDNHYYSLKADTDMFGSSEKRVSEKSIDLPGTVKEAIDVIFDYYKQENTVPSLAYIDDKLEQLYSNYVEAVYASIKNFNGTSMLGSKEYNITRLGIIENGDTILLTPFHPILVAYMLQFKRMYDGKGYNSKIIQMLTPYYLIPYLSIDGKYRRPCSDTLMGGIRTWMSYVSVEDKSKGNSSDITTRMVHDKAGEFIKNFSYLFIDKDCPLKINTVGIEDDYSVVKGLLLFIIDQYKVGKVQRIELHEYVDNILRESFFERLNRLGTNEKIYKELCGIGLDLSQHDFSVQEIIRLLFTRVVFYKHKLSACDNKVGYSHITFYEMNTGSNFITPDSNEMRTELSMDGLVSIPSTLNVSGTYQIGFGTKNLSPSNALFRAAMAMNTLYANEKDNGANRFNRHSCVAKNYVFDAVELLESIYRESNWVTFINPEVDIDFFYKQKDLYIVHYVDQNSINARYDSITVTKHIAQYENLLKRTYGAYMLPDSDFEHFNRTMLTYFNCLNGSWLLSVANKTDYQIREKMSIVATCVVLQKFLTRCKNIIWIPVSLDEIFRVTGSIGLPMDSILSKKALGIKGELSDDLVMLGLDATDMEHLKLYYYPAEVKYSRTGVVVNNGLTQVYKCYHAFRDKIFGAEGFTRKVYETFFASQFLSGADKFKANSVLSEKDYETIEECRVKLLNLDYEICEMPVKELGKASVVYYTEDAINELFTDVVDDVPVCHIHLSEKECYQCVANCPEDVNRFLTAQDIKYNVIQQQSDQLAGTDVDTEDNRSQNDADKDHSSSQASSSSHDQETTDAVHDSTSHSASSNEQRQDGQLAVSPIRIIMGENFSHHQLVFEPNNTQMVSHPNLAIIGTMGTGKTQLARSVIAQFAKEGGHNVGGNPIGMLVFDYKGDYKDKDFLDAVGGKCYAYNYPFNPLKLVITPGAEAMNLPSITADRISDSFSKAYGLGNKQRSRIKDVIKDTYEQFGITRDPSTWTKPAPTLSQVIDNYFDKYDADDSVYALFSTLSDYSMFTTDNSACVSMFEWLKGVRVIDLTMYPDNTKRVIVSLILDLFYAEMKQLGDSKTNGIYRELRAMILVDEAHQFLSKGFNSLRLIVSEGRMFGVGMILSTQNLSDFKTANNDYSSFFLSWAIHHVNNISKSELASIFGNSDPKLNDYMSFIDSAKTFQCIMKLGGRVDAIKDLPYFQLVKEDDRFKVE